jgi:hypothetical protein
MDTSNIETHLRELQPYSVRNQKFIELRDVLETAERSQLTRTTLTNAENND